IDAHVHVWTPDISHYPLAGGFKKEDMKPTSFTPEELFKLCKPAGGDRINLIQMSFYGFGNKNMLDIIALLPEELVGNGSLHPAAREPDRLMTDLARKKVRAFRIYPGLERGIKPNAGTGEKWLEAEGYARMFATGAKNNQAMSCLINPDALPDLDRMCKKYPGT